MIQGLDFYFSPSMCLSGETNFHRRTEWLKKEAALDAHLEGITPATFVYASQRIFDLA